jgi:Flp pilus assembly pilin Flp
MSMTNVIRLRTRRLIASIHGEAGAVATEYGLLLTLIALAIIIAAGLYGASVMGLFDQGTDAFP